MKRIFQIEKTGIHKMDERGEMSKSSACFHIDE